MTQPLLFFCQFFFWDLTVPKKTDSSGRESASSGGTYCSGKEWLLFLWQQQEGLCVCGYSVCLRSHISIEYKSRQTVTQCTRWIYRQHPSGQEPIGSICATWWLDKPSVCLCGAQFSQIAAPRGLPMLRRATLTSYQSTVAGHCSQRCLIKLLSVGR